MIFYPMPYVWRERSVVIPHLYSILVPYKIFMICRPIPIPIERQFNDATPNKAANNLQDSFITTLPRNGLSFETSTSDMKLLDEATKFLRAMNTTNQETQYTGSPGDTQSLGLSPSSSSSSSFSSSSPTFSYPGYGNRTFVAASSAQNTSTSTLTSTSTSTSTSQPCRTRRHNTPNIQTSNCTPQQNADLNVVIIYVKLTCRCIKQ